MSEDNALIVKCPNCDQLNRVKVPYSSNRRPICSKCWTPLTIECESSQSPKSHSKDYEYSKQDKPFASKWFHKKKSKNDKWLLFVGLSIIATVGYNLLSFEPIETNRGNYYNPPVEKYSQPKQQPTKPIYPQEALPVESEYTKKPLPANGRTQYFSSKESIAPFEIKTSKGEHYLVKLVDTNTKADAVTIFVRGGATTTVDVPIGTYELKYASGKVWYGNIKLFGRKTNYNMADESFKFSQSYDYSARGYNVLGHTVTLYKVANGNLTTHEIDASQF